MFMHRMNIFAEVKTEKPGNQKVETPFLLYFFGVFFFLLSLLGVSVKNL